MGTDNDEAILSAADGFVSSEGLDDVVLMKDDIFAGSTRPSVVDGL
ncbi:MAG: hypothetical protein M3O70_06250 [Actinomycetota bacterium]|nr:hypothetical protein [Actinomycetota bacterium]